MSELETAEMKKYLKKIKEIIENPTFKFMDNRYVKKVRIDDLICCMEANFPESFKKIVKERKFSAINSGKFYKNLLSTLKAKKSILFSDCYIVPYKAAVTYIESFTKNIDSDLKKLEENSSNML